jgi:HK97 family phage major capsid protein
MNKEDIIKMAQKDAERILRTTAKRKIKFGGEPEMAEKKTLVEIIKKTLAESTGAGVLVPEEHANYIFGLLAEGQVVRKAGATVVNMKSDTLVIPRMITGATAYWVDEANAITPSDPAFDTITLQAKKVAAMTYLTNELLEDSVADVEKIVLDNLSQTLAAEMDKEMLIGDGTHLTGIVNTSGVNSLDLTGNALTIDDLIEARALIEEATKGNIKPNAIIMHPAVYYKLLKEAKDNTGRYLADLQGLTAGLPDTLLGMKVFTTTAIPTNLTDGTHNNLSLVIVGDFKQAIIGQRRNISLNADNSGQYFVQDIVALRALARVGFGLAYPNAFTVIKNVATA